VHVVRDVHVLHFVLKLLGFYPLEVLLDLSDGVALGLGSFAAVHDFGESLLDFDELEALAEVPVSEELLDLIFTMERGGGQFVTPERSIGFLGGSVDVVLVLIGDHLLVVGGETEGPDVVFFEAVVHSHHVGVRGVRVQGLALDVVEMQVFIIVIVWDSRGGSNVMLGFALRLLDTLEVVDFVQINIIDIILEVAVIFNSFTETSEVRVQVGTHAVS